MHVSPERGQPWLCTLGGQVMVSEVAGSWQPLRALEASHRRELAPVHAASTFQTGGRGCMVLGSSCPVSGQKHLSP